MALAVEGVVDGGADAAALAGVAVARGDAVLAPDSAVTPLADAQEAVGASGLARAPDARRHLAPLHLGEQSESLFLLICFSFSILFAMFARSSITFCLG